MPRMKAKELEACITLFGPKFAPWAERNHSATAHLLVVLRSFVELCMARFSK
jgi:hypothetical protein